MLTSGQQRGSLWAEVSGQFLRFSANYYQPLSGWYDDTDSMQSRMAHGYDVATQGYLPFYQQSGVSLSYEQYLGSNVDLFNSGTYCNNPAAIGPGINHTPYANGFT